MKKLGKNSLSLIGLLDTKLTNVSDNSSDLPSGMGRILEGLSRFQSTIPQQLPIKPGKCRLGYSLVTRTTCKSL